MRITSLEICLLSLPTEELEIIGFSGSIPKDHASAEADSFWPLDQVQIFFVTFGDCYGDGLGVKLSRDIGAAI